MEPYRIAYLGNFEPSHSTENHVAASLESLGHIVLRVQEGAVLASQVADVVGEFGADAFFWTQTYGLAETGGTCEERWSMLLALHQLDVPSVGFHLDRWWGLDRQDQVGREAFFGVDHLFTADGGHDDGWREVGANHHWSPPGVFHGECGPGEFTSRFASDVAFVGNWRGGYHAEWRHRAELISFLQRGRWRRRTMLWPRGAAVRGEDLRNLYASVKVLVGDSCLVGDCSRYWSDRIPETLGRGGFLLHPFVDGIEEHFTDGKHLRLWPLGDWRELDRLIAYYLEHDDERRAIAEEGRRHVLEHHTYRTRMQWVLQTVLGE